VMIGDLNHMKLPDIKAIFVLGVNDGVLPAAGDNGGLITDAEKKALAKEGIDIGARDPYEEEKIDIYSVFSKPRQQLFLSWALSRGGEPAKPAILIGRIKNIFPKIREKTDRSDGPPYLLTPDGMFEDLVDTVRLRLDGAAVHEGWDDVLAWYLNDAAWRERIAKLKTPLCFENDEKTVSGELAAVLYGSLSGSVTRIETYYNCPFKHFMQYGLKPQPLREYEETPLDIGDFLHRCLHRFTQALLKRSISWADADADTIDELTAQSMERVTADHNEGILTDDVRYRVLGDRLAHELKTAVKIVQWQLKGTPVNVYGSEAAFGINRPVPAYKVALDNGETYDFSGKVDRIDLMPTDKGRFLRIIDYKLNGKTFDLTGFFYGTDIQLFVYLKVMTAALKQKFPDIKPGGAFYFDLSIPLTEPDGADAVKRAALERRMDGVVYDDPEAALLMNKKTTPNGYLMDAAKIGITKKGRFHGRYADKIFSDAEWKAAFDHADGLIKNAIQNITAGDTAVLPYKEKDRTACDWCEYRPVCKFDEIYAGCAYRETEKKRKEDILNAGRDGA